MEAARNKEAVRRYFEDVLTNGDLEVLDGITRPDLVSTTPSASSPDGKRSRT